MGIPAKNSWLCRQAFEQLDHFFAETIKKRSGFSD